MGKNAFADLGFPAAEAAALQARVTLALEIERYIAKHRLTQTKAAAAFGVPQPTISKIRMRQPVEVVAGYLDPDAGQGGYWRGDHTGATILQATRDGGVEQRALPPSRSADPARRFGVASAAMTDARAALSGMAGRVARGSGVTTQGGG